MASNFIITGVYTGNGTSQTIELGARPKHLWLLMQDGMEVFNTKNSLIPDDDFLNIISLVDYDGLGGPTFLDTGFSVGNDPKVNTLNGTIYYVAWI